MVRGPKKAKLQGYDVRALWLNLDLARAEAAHGVPAYPELENEEVYAIGRSYSQLPSNGEYDQRFRCWYLKTVHNISIDMELQTEEASDGRIIDFQMTGPLHEKTLRTA